MSINSTIALILGFGSHVIYFRRGEHHMSGPRLAAFVPLIWTLIIVLRLRNESRVSAVRESTLTMVSYAVGLCCSMVVYRVFFHPLRHFPGPVLAKVSKFWHVFWLSGLQNHLLMEDLHQKYGDIVRIGTFLF